jgi:hypothetical protein
VGKLITALETIRSVGAQVGEASIHKMQSLFAGYSEEYGLPNLALLERLHLP